MVNTNQTLNTALGANIILEPSNFPGFQYNEKFGRNTTVGTSAFEDIWEEDANLVWPTTARVMSVTTTGNDNGTLSSGARKVMIEGLDENWNVYSEEVTTATAVPPTTAQKFIRVNRAYVTEVGTNGTNENDIIITQTTENEIQARIVAGLGQSEKSQFTVPLNKKCTIFDISTSCHKGDDFQWEIMTRKPGEAWRIRKMGYIYQNEYSGQSFIETSEMTDIMVRAKAGILNSEIDCSYRFILYNE